jgi:cytoskeleton protein RodZ
LTELTGVGARLRQAREAQGLAIDDVAQSLKYAPRQIESLENERFDRLPGPTIARGMVRNYARLLRLDAESLLERMAPHVEKAPDPAQIAPRLRREVAFSDGARRSTFLYAGFSIGLLILVGALAYEWQQQKATPEFVAPARERPEPVEAVQAMPVSEPLPLVVSQPRPTPVEEKKAEAAKTEVAIAPPAEAEKPLAAGTHRIVLRCEQEAWLEVRDGTGKLLISSLSPAGSERTVRGRPPFELVIGNADAVKVTYDGKPVDLRPYIKVEVARLTLK